MNIYLVGRDPGPISNYVLDNCSDDEKDFFSFGYQTGNLREDINYYGTQSDFTLKRIISTVKDIKKDIEKSDVIFIIPNRFSTMYIELGIALALNKDIWVIGSKEDFDSRKMFPFKEYDFNFLEVSEFNDFFMIEKHEDMLQYLERKKV